MSIKMMDEVLKRMLLEQAFRDLMVRDPERALTGYDLLPTERAAFLQLSQRQSQRKRNGAGPSGTPSEQLHRPEFTPTNHKRGDQTVKIGDQDNQRPVVTVDQNAIKAGQTITMLLLLAAFVLNSWPLAALVAGANLLGAAFPPLSLFAQIYRRLLIPLGLVQPNLMPDRPEPHRFAQGFSGAVTALSALLVWGGFDPAGWALSWLVIALANLNVFAGFCAGCFTYFQLSRLGLPGFKRNSQQI